MGSARNRQAERQGDGGRSLENSTSVPFELIRFAPLLLARTFPRESLLGPPLVSRLEIKRVLLDIFNNVFLLNLPLEPAKCAFDRLALLDFHFSHASNTPSCDKANMLG